MDASDGIAIAALVVSIGSAVIAWASWRASKASIAKRNRSRAVLGDALLAGHQLRRLFRQPKPENTQRWLGWLVQAEAAVKEADPAQLARFQAPVADIAYEPNLEELLRRLQEIQDRL